MLFVGKFGLREKCRRPGRNEGARTSKSQIGIKPIHILRNFCRSCFCQFRDRDCSWSERRCWWRPGWWRWGNSYDNLSCQSGRFLRLHCGWRWSQRIIWLKSHCWWHWWNKLWWHRMERRFWRRFFLHYISGRKDCDCRRWRRREWWM